MEVVFLATAAKPLLLLLLFVVVGALSAVAYRLVPEGRAKVELFRVRTASNTARSAAVAAFFAVVLVTVAVLAG